VAELETAVRCGLPVVVVVGQDNAWGVELLLQTGLYGDDAAFTSELSQSDFAMVAKGFGCGAVTVDGPAEVEDALADALAAREPRLIQVGIRNVRSRATERMVASLRSSRGS
jgi:acetolactate synthase-1/2/3 large subunit